MRVEGRRENSREEWMECERAEKRYAEFTVYDNGVGIVAQILLFVPSARITCM